MYIYSNSRVLGYGRPTGPTRQPEDVLFKKKEGVFKKGDTSGVIALGACEGYRKGTPKWYVAGRLKKGGSVCRMATGNIKKGECLT